MELTANANTANTANAATIRAKANAAPRARDIASPSGKRLWTGRVMTGLIVAFLLFDSVAKLLRVDAVVAGSAELGYRAGAIIPMGAILLACVIVYLIPRTALLGAVLLTGYLGGAIATHLRVGNPLFTHTLFPIYVALLAWGGLYLRDGRVRGLFARRRTA